MGSPQDALRRNICLSYEALLLPQIQIFLIRVQINVNFFGQRSHLKNLSCADRIQRTITKTLRFESIAGIGYSSYTSSRQNSFHYANVIRTSSDFMSERIDEWIQTRNHLYSPYCL